VQPPRSPKLDGHVERMRRSNQRFASRSSRDAFYTRPPELQRELNAHLDHRNRERPLRALGGLAPPWGSG